MIKIQKDVELKHLTTFRVGGKTKYFVEIDKDQEVVEAIGFAKTNNLEIFVLGGGSDILMSDKDFGGLVIKHIGKKVRFGEGEGKVLVSAEAGTVWDDLVQGTVEKDLQGIESLSGIPGTVGASPIQNIGAYGQELKDVFVSLKAFDFEKGEFVEMDKDECDFSYRESIFKKSKNRNRFFITKVFLELWKNKKPNPTYKSLTEELRRRKIDNPTVKDVREAVLYLRGKKLEDPNVIGNAGSFFKNPIVKKQVLDKLLLENKDLPYFEKGGEYKLFSGYLIEKAGWKGKEVGGAKVSKKNALILTNPGGATAKDIKKLSEEISKDVEKKFGVKLEPEVRFVNF